MASTFSEKEQWEARCSGKNKNCYKNTIYSDETWPFPQSKGRSLKYHAVDYPTSKDTKPELELASVESLYDRRGALVNNEKKHSVDKKRLILIPLDFEFGTTHTNNLLKSIVRHFDVHFQGKVTVTVAESYRLFLPGAELIKTISKSDAAPTFIWRCPIVSSTTGERKGSAIVRSSYSQKKADEVGLANTLVHYREGKKKKQETSPYVKYYGHEEKGAEIVIRKTGSKKTTYIFPSQVALAPEGSSPNSWMEQSVEILNNYLEENRDRNWDDIMHFTNSIQEESRDKHTKLVPAALVLSGRNLFYADANDYFGTIEGSVSTVEKYRPGLLSEATYIEENLSSSDRMRHWCDYLSPIVPKTIKAWNQAYKDFCRTVLHEFLHIFDFRHCAYYPCAMNGAYSVAEGKRQPYVNCPITSRRIAIFWEIEQDSPEKFKRYKESLKKYMEEDFEFMGNHESESKATVIEKKKPLKKKLSVRFAPTPLKTGDSGLLPSSTWKKKDIKEWAEKHHSLKLNMSLTKQQMLDTLMNNIIL